MADAEQLQLELSDGRILEALVSGPADGMLLVFHHGSPGAAVPFGPLEDAAAQRSIRVCMYSRPGFGESTRDPGRRIASCAADVAALADHLGADRFLTAGWSGGGPHAVACAALLPDRVAAAATIASVAPFNATGLDWTDGMGEDNQIEYPLAARDPDELLRWLAPQVEMFSHIRAAELLTAMRSLISDVDAALLTGELGQMMATSFQRAVAHGRWGWYDDDLAFVAPWGVDLARIRVPVTVWQGEQDLMVPPAHGRWLAAHIPGARAELHPQHGHLSLAVGNLGAILDVLLGEC